MYKHTFAMRVSFGDCDPAGIVFYPNIFAWLDRTFHDWLWEFGGHEDVCGRLGALGLGLMDVSAKFHRPMRNGDELRVCLTVEEWGPKALKLVYEIYSGETLTATGRETRGVFVLGENGISAARLDKLRELLDARET